MTWAIIVFNILMLVWLVGGASSAPDDANCEEEATRSLQDACEAGTAIGVGLGVGIIIFLWVAGVVILGVLWLITNRTSSRECPSCGTDVKKGLTECRKCGYDFRPSAAGESVGLTRAEGPMNAQTGGDQPQPEFDQTRQIPVTEPPAPPPPTGPGTRPGDSDGRRWETWHMAVAAFVALVLGIGIGAVGSGGDEQTDVAADDTTSTTTTDETTEAPAATEAPTTTATTAPPPPPPPAEDVEIASYSGSGSQSMRPFTVEDGWEVQWDFTGDILQIYIHTENGGMGGIAANQQGSGSGSSYQGRGGTFYLQTNAMGDWTIRIVDVP